MPTHPTYVLKEDYQYNPIPLGAIYYININVPGQDNQICHRIIATQSSPTAMLHKLTEAVEDQNTQPIYTTSSYWRLHLQYLWICITSALACIVSRSSYSELRDNALDANIELGLVMKHKGPHHALFRGLTSFAHYVFKNISYDTLDSYRHLLLLPSIILAPFVYLMSTLFLKTPEAYTLSQEGYKGLVEASITRRAVTQDQHREHLSNLEKLHNRRNHSPYQIMPKQQIIAEKIASTTQGSIFLVPTDYLDDGYKNGLLRSIIKESQNKVQITYQDKSKYNLLTEVQFGSL
ncbi:hypothetical protein [Candidatus Synchoanobacter obligatus]|uniref:Uncharacterized protein n=1 Tax=Candidatus Synchoanobacter obligatus TaxID=2919597 RepID=A0ABT1L537_9GAMM|nr:hypothetical protein [Candidatus Synchoanobacter obligatus]MCP8351840.1 hypothetical protein [Candidatus Synchoanobacter obligatus]